MSSSSYPYDSENASLYQANITPLAPPHPMPRFSYSHVVSTPPAAPLPPNSYSSNYAQPYQLPNANSLRKSTFSTYFTAPPAAEPSGSYSKHHLYEHDSHTHRKRK
ncbi:hypothetical protein V9T40_011301 [Parthenolecanium corni]|uniref:Uncharacterized protein n=1 Tax=Parthenolecanium corni TaxID=536013 RepID=A0AAN9T5T3_9HEMI